MIALVLALLASRAAAQETLPELIRDVGIDQHLGDRVPLDLPLVDERGRSVRLGEYLSDKPVIVTLVSYECEMLCAESLNRLLRALRGLDLDLGKDFRVLSVTFDPEETPQQALEQQRAYLKRYGRPGAGGWHFLTGSEASIKTLAKTLGIRYRYDRRSDQYVHPAGLVMLTPQGEISRYVPGLDYTPRDLRLALVEASENKIGTLADQVLLLCYQYDPSSGRYSLAIFNLVRTGGVLTVLAIAGFVIVSIRRERRRGRTAAASENPDN